MDTDGEVRGREYGAPAFSPASSNAVRFHLEKPRHICCSVGGRLRPPGMGADPELEAPGTFWGGSGSGSGAGSSGHILGRERERIRSWKLRAHSGEGAGADPELEA
ncbi:MAG: hypothetical protein WCT05_11015, partial [Lentisphaeria bacterium]